MASIFTEAESWATSLRTKSQHWHVEKAEMSRRDRSIGYRPGNGSLDTPFDSPSVQYDDSERSRRQYDAFKDTAFTTIRPLAVKGSSLPIRCGIDRVRASGKKDSRFDFMFNKWLATDPRWIGDRRHLMPDFIKGMDEDIDPLKDHFLLRLLANPNEQLTGNKLKYLSFASMALTGRFIWWFDTTGETRTDDPSLGSLRLWYLPRSWVRTHEGGEPGMYRIQSPGMAGSISVTANELFLSTIPDPGNPFMPHSPLQTQAKSIDTDDKILRAQAISMDNAMRPNMILTAGRLPGMPGMSGRGPRPILTGDQRQQLIDAIKLMHQGVHKWGEPLIIDGLIEDAKPYMPSPSELDMLNSSEAVRRRVMEGLGVSPVVAGFAENANRSGSVIAKEVFYEIALNPMVSMVSEDMDSVLGPRFSLGGSRLRVWMETAEAVDPDALAARVSMMSDVLTDDEKRKFALSGKLQLDDNEWTKEKKRRDEMASQAASRGAEKLASDAGTRAAVEGNV